MLALTTLSGPPSGDLASISVGPFGGLIDALVNSSRNSSRMHPRGPATAGTDLTGLLDPSTLLSGLDLGNLGGLLDPSTLLGDVTSLLPGLAADVPAQLAADLATAHSVLISEIAVAAAGPSADGAGLGVVS